MFQANKYNILTRRELQLATVRDNYGVLIVKDNMKLLISHKGTQRTDRNFISLQDKSQMVEVIEVPF